MKTYAMRLRPGVDLKVALRAFALENRIEAGAILTAVGSLTQASIRFAGQPNSTLIKKEMEILSLVGTLCPDGLHLHLTVADNQGSTLGGHMMDGCIVRTTAEIVIGDLPATTFTRETDSQTGYEELVVS